MANLMNPHRCLAAFVALASFLFPACQTTTTDGTSLLKVTLTHEQGGPPSGFVSTKTGTHKKQIKVSHDKEASVEVRVDAVEDANGNKYIKALEVISTKNAGGEVGAALPSSSKPANMGTPQAVLTQVVIMVSWAGRDGCTKQTRQAKVDVDANGKVISHGDIP